MSSQHYCYYHYCYSRDRVMEWELIEWWKPPKGKWCWEKDKKGKTLAQS